MTDCPDGLMRDLLPEYALGVLAAEDAARVDAHLTACDACRAELRLLAQVQTAVALDTPPVDVAAIVRALPGAPASAVPTLRLERRAPWRRHIWQYAAAAGLLLVAGGGLFWPRGGSESGREVADSSHVRTTAVVESAVGTVTSPEDGITFGGGLSDLSLEELQALLGQMDSVRTLPSSDPESVTPVIAMNEGGKTL